MGVLECFVPAVGGDWDEVKFGVPGLPGEVVEDGGYGDGGEGFGVVEGFSFGVVEFVAGGCVEFGLDGDGFERDVDEGGEALLPVFAVFDEGPGGAVAGSLEFTDLRDASLTEVPEGSAIVTDFFR